MSYAIIRLSRELVFPPVHLSEPDGLLAMGGDLSTERLLLAYRSGIFPWFDGDTPLWWCPDPRFILLPAELKISKSMKQLINRRSFEFTTDKAFAAVIGSCKTSPRKEQQGTWITDEVKAAYIQLHQLGYAHSGEACRTVNWWAVVTEYAWERFFFGESMFSKTANASKYAFIQYVQLLQQQDLQLIDCQVYTPHLESLGAKMITRSKFVDMLHTLIV